MWLSASGGVAVAYVFLHILPELASHREVFADALSLQENLAETIVYGLALVGLAAFYGMEQFLRQASAQKSDDPDGEKVSASADTFWLHISSFSVYNLIIGYLLLHREENGPVSLAIFGVAMALHFLTNDYGLRRDHRIRYDRYARWVLGAAVLAGWGIGLFISLPEIGIALLFAFLSGAVVLNVMKEELPGGT